MQITVNVQLQSDDNFAYTPDAAAAQVIAALGGNPANDYCQVYLSSATAGASGTPAPAEATT